MATHEIRLGLRENLGQFSLLVVVNAFVGAMVGLERSILPAVAVQDFHLAAKAAILSFIVVFGVSKALTNYLAGRLSDHFGRKHVLVAGWMVAAPVPFLLMWAPQWDWIVAANVLLGVSQGLTWSTTVIMKIDLVGPKQRGLAMGLNEFAGYAAVAASAMATGWMAAHYGLRPQPFYLGVVYVAAGLLLSALTVHETRHHVAHEVRNHQVIRDDAVLSQREIFWRTSLTDRNLASISQAGMVNNLNDGMAWGLFPLVFTAAGMNLAQIGMLAAIYPAIWGCTQVFTGALSDRIGRKWLIAGGMWVQAAGIAVTAVTDDFLGFAMGGVLLGIGTAMVYPTLLAAIGDVAHPSWRASAVGVYRLWRDLGYALGALLAGITADLFGMAAAVWLIAGLTLLSGMIAAVQMNETLIREKNMCEQKQTISFINPQSLRELIYSGEKVVIVDVRSPEEFAVGHVENAINIPSDQLAAQASNLPGDANIVTVCNLGGSRSCNAAEQLHRLGYDKAVSLRGGTRGWLEEETRTEDHEGP